MFRTEVVEEIKHTFCVKKFFFSFFENRVVYEIMWKNIVDRGRPQVTIWRMLIACWIAQTANTLEVCNSYCFSTTTVVVRPRLKVTLFVYCLCCFCITGPLRVHFFFCLAFGMTVLCFLDAETVLILAK